MNKVVSFAMLALLALAAACGPKAQAGGGTTVAPPVGGAPAAGRAVRLRRQRRDGRSAADECKPRIGPGCALTSDKSRRYGLDSSARPPSDITSAPPSS